MVRRSFRMGLWVGLLAGILVAAVKMVQTRRKDQEWEPVPTEWPPVETAATPPMDAGHPPSTATDSVTEDNLPLTPDEPEPLPPIRFSMPPPGPPPGVPAAVPPLPSDDVQAPVPPLEEERPEPVVRAPGAPAPVGKRVAKKASPSKAAKRAGTKKSGAKRAGTKKSGAKRAAKKASKAAVRKATSAAAPSLSWVEPDDGACPRSHPVKAKLASGLFHLPGMAFYNRTRADRCYADEESAASDGLIKSKR